LRRRLRADERRLRELFRVGPPARAHVHRRQRSRARRARRNRHDRAARLIDAYAQTRSHPHLLRSNDFSFGPFRSTDGSSLILPVVSPTSESTFLVWFSIAANRSTTFGNSSMTVVRLLFSDGISGT